MHCIRELWSQSDLNGLTYSISMWVGNRLDFGSKYFKFYVFVRSNSGDFFSLHWTLSQIRIHIEIQLEK